MMCFIVMWNRSYCVYHMSLTTQVASQEMISSRRACAHLFATQTSLSCNKSFYITDMKVTAAWSLALHYAHANPRTITVATGSVAAIACPALLSAVAFNAAGLTASSPVAGGFALLFEALFVLEFSSLVRWCIRTFTIHGRRNPCDCSSATKRCYGWIWCCYCQWSGTNWRCDHWASSTVLGNKVDIAKYIPL